MRIWRADGTLERELLRHESGTTSVAWSPDSAWIAATVRGESKVRLWRPDGTQSKALDIGPAVGAAVAWHDAERLAIGCYGFPNTVQVWSPDGRLIDAFFAGSHVQSVAWSPDGLQLATGNWEHRVGIWNTPGADPRPAVAQWGHLDRSVVDLDWKRDGRCLAVGLLFDLIVLQADDGMRDR